MAVIRRRATALVGIAAVSALVLSGCAAAEEETTSAGGDTGSSSGSDEGLAAGCEAFEEYAGLSGTEVELYSTIVGTEADAFRESFVEFEDCTGITINWNGSQDFEAQLPVRAAGGTAPELALFPQPGLLAAMQATGEMFPAPQSVQDSVAANFTPDWQVYGSVDGELYGAPFGANVKSFVWFSPSVFEANGWDTPTTWPELLELSDTILETSDIQPWCVGFGSGEATGWVGTDWMEDLMLRFQDGETYDQWVAHDIAFNDPKVAEVLAEAGKIIKNPDYVGNVSAIATTTFQDGGKGVVDGTCAMHRQASFFGGIAVNDFGATIVEPDDTATANGISTFYFPGLTADNKPALGGGEFIGAFSDAPEVEAVMLYLTSADYHNKRASLNNWFSAHQGLDTANIADPVNSLGAEILQNATVFRFDASDVMPAEVGAGSFWREMTAWVAEDKSDQAVLDAIEASWPAS